MRDMVPFLISCHIIIATKVMLAQLCDVPASDGFHFLSCSDHSPDIAKKK